MAGHILSDFIVVNYTKQDKDDCIHFLTHIDPNVRQLQEIVSPTARRVYTSKYNVWYLKKYFEVGPNVFHGMETEHTYKIEVKGKKFLFSFIDSRYNTGSVMIILRGGFGTLLYTGYFSYYPGILESPILRAIINRKALTKLYLDTTYYEQVTGFRSMADNIEKIVHLIRESMPKKIYIYLEGMGLEHLLVDIAQSLNEFMTVDAKTMTIMEQLNRSHFFTRNPMSSRIYVTSSLVTTRPHMKTEEIEIIVLERITTPTQAYTSYMFVNNKHRFKFYGHPTHADCCTMISSLMAETLIPIGRNNFNNKIIYKPNLTEFSYKISKLTSGDQNFFPKPEMSSKLILGQNRYTVKRKPEEGMKKDVTDSDRDRQLAVKKNESSSPRSIISEVTGNIQRESLRETREPSNNGLNVYPGPTFTFIKNVMKIGRNCNKNENSEMDKKQENSSKEVENFQANEMCNTDTRINSNTMHLKNTESLLRKTDDLSLYPKPIAVDSRRCNVLSNLKIRNVDEINKSLYIPVDNCPGRLAKAAKLDNVVNPLDETNSLQEDTQSENVRTGDKFVEIFKKDHNLCIDNYKSGCLILKNITGVGEFLNKRDKAGTETRSLKCNNDSASSSTKDSEQMSQMNSEEFTNRRAGKRIFVDRKKLESLSAPKKMLTDDRIINKKDTLENVIESLNNSVLEKSQSKEQNLLTMKPSFTANKRESVLNEPCNQGIVTCPLLASDVHPTKKENEKGCEFKESSGSPNNMVNAGQESTCLDISSKNKDITKTIGTQQTIIKPHLLSVTESNSQQLIDHYEALPLEQHQYGDTENDFISKDIEGLNSQITNKEQNKKRKIVVISPENVSILNSASSTPTLENKVKSLNMSLRKSLNSQKPLLLIKKSILDKNVNNKIAISCVSAGPSAPHNVYSERNAMKKKISCIDSKEGTNKDSKSNDASDSSFSLISANAKALHQVDKVMIVAGCSTSSVGEIFETGLSNEELSVDNEGKLSNNISEQICGNNNKKMFTAARVRIFKRSLMKKADCSCFKHVIPNKNLHGEIESPEMDNISEINTSKTQSIDNNSDIDLSVGINNLQPSDDYLQFTNGIEIENSNAHENDNTKKYISDTKNESAGNTLSQSSDENESRNQVETRKNNNNLVFNGSQSCSQSLEAEICEDVTREEDTIKSQLNNEIESNSCNSTLVKINRDDEKTQKEEISGNIGNSIIIYNSAQTDSQDLAINAIEREVKDTSTLLDRSNSPVILSESTTEINIMEQKVKLPSDKGYLPKLEKIEERRRHHRLKKLPSFISESYVVGKIAKSTNKRIKQVNPLSDCKSNAPSSVSTFKTSNKCETLLSEETVMNQEYFFSNSKLYPYVLLDRNYLNISRYTYSFRKNCFIPYHRNLKFRGTFVRRNYNKNNQKRIINMYFEN